MQGDVTIEGAGLKVFFFCCPLFSLAFLYYSQVIERKAKSAKKEVSLFGEAESSGPNPMVLGAAAVAVLAAAAYFTMAH